MLLPQLQYIVSKIKEILIVYEGCICSHKKLPDKCRGGLKEHLSVCVHPTYSV